MPLPTTICTIDRNVGSQALREGNHKELCIYKKEGCLYTAIFFIDIFGRMNGLIVKNYKQYLSLLHFAILQVQL